MSEIGLRVGPFELVAPAAVPEMGRWFAARRVGTSSRGPAEVLVKLPHPKGPDAKALAKEFDRLRDLHDPRVPEAVGYWEGSGALALAKVHGLPLTEVVAAPEADRLSFGVVTWLEVVSDLAESVSRAHDRKLIHGHIDGAHVWVAPDGRLWLWGFGPGHRTEPDARWMSPERVLRLGATTATDQWSLAALALAVLTGTPPGDLGRLAEIDARLHPILGRWPGVARTLRKMLDPSPEHRFANVHTARGELLAQMRLIGGVSQRRSLGAWVAERLGGTLVPRGRADEDVEDEATVLVTPEVTEELAELRAERSRETRRVDPTWPGIDPHASHDQDATMLYSDPDRQAGDGEVDTDVNKRIDEALMEDEDSLVRAMDKNAVPFRGEIREPTDPGARPLDLPIDSPTAEKYTVPMLPDDDQSGPYHAAIDLTEIDTAPSEASFHGPTPAGITPRQMSGAERLATWLLAALAGSVLVWALVRMLT